MKPSRGILDAAASFPVFQSAEIIGALICSVGIPALAGGILFQTAVPFGMTLPSWAGSRARPSSHPRFVSAPSLRRQNARSGA